MDKLTPEKLEVFITQTLLDFREGKISYEDCVVRFGEKFVEVYQLTLEEKSPTYVSDEDYANWYDSFLKRDQTPTPYNVFEWMRSLIFKEGKLNTKNETK